MQNFQKLIKLPQLLLFLLGNAFVAYSYQGFVSANDFLSGGIYGVSGIVTYFFDFLPFSLVVLLFNIPCMIWAWRELEKRFVILTTVALLLQVVFLQLFEGVVIYDNDLLLAAIFAGVFVGAGDSLVLRSGSGSSGVHLIAMVLRQKFGISVSTVTTCINTVIILLSTGIFGIEKGLYTLILIFASGQVVHAILDGLSSKRTAFIITAKGEEVGAALIEGLNRGVTRLQAEGLYSHTQLSLLMCVTNILEVGRLKILVQSVDPQAFVTFYETTDFRGHFLKHNILVDKDEDAETAAMAPPKRPPRHSWPKAAVEPAAAPPEDNSEPKYQLTIQPGVQTDALTRQTETVDAPPAGETGSGTAETVVAAVEAATEAIAVTEGGMAGEASEASETGQPGETDKAAAESPAAEAVPPVEAVRPAPPQTSQQVQQIQPRWARTEEPQEAAEPEAVQRLRYHSSRASLRDADNTPAAAPSGVSRPARRSFEPPAPPGANSGRVRSNRDFWSDADRK